MAASPCTRPRTLRHAFANLPIDSPSVGCGWMVLPMSAPSQPISMDSAISPLHRSPVARMRADDGAADDVFNRCWIIKNPAIACGVFSVTTQRYNISACAAAASPCTRLRTLRRAFANLPIDSPSVGCGWMVLPMSVSSQPISMSSAISPLHRSPVARMRADDGAADEVFNRSWIIKNPQSLAGF